MSQRRRVVRLSEWAKREGINLRTAQRMHARGELPVPSWTTPTNRIMVSVPDNWPNPDTLAEVSRRLDALEQRLTRVEETLGSFTSLKPLTGRR